MTTSYSLSQLAQFVGGTLTGHDDGRVIRGVNDVSEAGPDQITWVSNPKYAAKLIESRAGAVLVPTDFGPTPMPAIVCAKIDQAVAKLLAAFARPIQLAAEGIHGSAVIHPSARIDRPTAIGPHVVIEADARIGPRCSIGAGVYIGAGSRLGNDCLVWPHVVIHYGCEIGNRVVIHPNVVIGADGYGYYFDEGEHHKVPHAGGVRIEDDVEIGSCSCIDRAKFGYTVIGRGTKIDNLVQVAHNVRVGQHCLLAGQVGIGGSVRIGNYCVFGGRAGAIDNLTIGDGAKLAGGVTIAGKDIPAGMTASGFPAQEHRAELRAQAVYRRLPELMGQWRELIARVEKLEASAHDQSRR